MPVLIYDGDCGFCTRAAEWARVRTPDVTVTPWQWADLAALGLTIERCRAAVQWIDEAGKEPGRAYAGAAAVAGWLTHRGGWGARLARLYPLPGMRQLADAGYRLVAQYRHRLPGGTPACRLPDQRPER